MEIKEFNEVLEQLAGRLERRAQEALTVAQQSGVSLRDRFTLQGKALAFREARNTVRRAKVGS